MALAPRSSFIPWCSSHVPPTLLPSATRRGFLAACRLPCRDVVVVVVQRQLHRGREGRAALLQSRHHERPQQTAEVMAWTRLLPVVRREVQLQDWSRREARPPQRLLGR
jgi:hypothetical protein